MPLSTQSINFKVFLVEEAHQLARFFSAQCQKQEDKAQKIYYNTLAIYAVKYYLQCMKIDTQWEISDSWNPILRNFLDVADLTLTNLGRLECRPVLAGKQSIFIPGEACEDRIGYIIVQLEPSLRKAELLGFVETIEMEEELQLLQLKPLKELLNCVERLQQAKLPKSVKEVRVNLNHWFNNVFDVDWLPIPILYNTLKSQLTFSVRNYNLIDSSHSNSSNCQSISRGKIIDLGIQMNNYFLALVLNIEPRKDGNINVLTQIIPLGKISLPKDIQLIILDENGAIYLKAKAREADQKIQLNFYGKPKERFSINIILGNANFTENFIF